MKRTNASKASKASKARTTQVQFELAADPGSQVFVAGSFNNWDPTANPMKDNPDSGDFKATLPLPAGTHEYKFVVNGVWTMDPQGKHWAPNAFGSLNNVIHVPSAACTKASAG